MSSKDKKSAGIVWRGVGRVGNVFSKRPIVFTACVSVIIVLIVEMLARRSLWQGFAFAFSHPVRFLANALIVLATLSLSFLFKRRSFFVCLVSVVWLAFGIVNFTILDYRPTPFGIIDIQLLPSVFSIINVYLDPWQIVLLCVGAVLVLGALVYLFIRVPKATVVWKKTLLFIAGSIAGAVLLYIVVYASGVDRTTDDKTDIARAYEDYGFVYCFCTGMVDKGIDRPEDYTQEAVEEIVSSLEASSAPELRPDIIFVQLESFFDVGYLDDVSYDENPIPEFTSLKRKYSTGFLTVPSVGAGTANTEFEVLSGMSLGFFGMGEYPYKTILKEEACETVATDLKQLGYTSHAIHNNTGSFYDRNVVFAQLGFDTFTSIEYMNDVEYNPIGWAKDKILTEQIIKALDSTDGQDFVFTITVQGHGKYQRGEDTDEADDQDVEWEEDPDSEKAFAYYLSQLQETDQFIGELVDAIEARGEPAVVVFYGDHLPNFSIGSDQLENGDVFETEYVIWDNLGLEKRDVDLTAYQLSAFLMERLGIKQGILSRYHQTMSGSESEDYRRGLGLLEYDMLYGDFYCYGGENPYQASDLQMGIDPIIINRTYWSGSVLYVYGENFTPFSRVTVDGDLRETRFVNDSVLVMEGPEPERGSDIAVAQVTDGLVTLSESESVKYRG